jgi:DNA helicase-2/ATP-dependent DNA helicase PcrA
MVTESIDYARELNPAQYQAVTAGDGPVLVVAGAGSGKTRTLVYRVAWLVGQGVAPESILLLTFTRKAAQEMLNRATTILDGRCQQVTGGTFHWLANRVLHRYSRRLAFEPDFTVIDRGDAEQVIGFLLGRLGLRRRHRGFPRKRTIVDMFSKAVNRDEALEELVRGEYHHFLEFTRELGELHRHYAPYKLQHQLMDFDDLLVYLRRLLLGHRDVCEALSARYRYILVDEYQDTNPLQADIVEALATVHRNLMVVGDDSQAIYAFRGAHLGNILDFHKVFPEVAIFKLEENFRSSQPILDVANGIIAASRQRYTKCLYTVRPDGDRPLLATPLDEEAQSEYVCATVRQLQAEGIPLSEVAVLFRASYHSFDLEVALTRYGIPFVKYGGFKFVESAHIKDILAHLRAWRNPRDPISWNRALLLVDQVGSKRSEEIITYLAQDEPGLTGLAAYASRLPPTHELHRLVSLFERLSTPGLSVSQQVRAVREYYEPIVTAKYDDHPRRLRELDYLQDWTSKYDRLEDFLADIALEPPNTNVPPADSRLASDHLVLSTIHSAKGLEWRAVFVISAVEGRLPSSHARADEHMMEEERRLLYVAVTRAKDVLTICCPQRVYDRKTGFRFADPSRFLHELAPERYFDHPEEAPSRSGARPGPEEAQEAGFAPGDAVRHPFFGRGRVIAVPHRLKVRVQFEDGHNRLLHLDYAPLERVSAVF